MKNILLLTALLLLFINSCQFNGEDGNELKHIHVIHAGSLTKPVHVISKAFEKENPGVRINTEAWGSKAGARRIADLHSSADIFMSADYMVIKNLLIPEHASWYIPFATNELSIVYTPNSRYAGKINSDNWMKILLKDDVKYGRSNPDHDPCGVRSVFTIKLAEKKYNKPGFANKLLSKDKENIRPKETDLIALLESNHIDYIFLYKSVAVQHNLKYIALPDSLNLGNFELNDWYKRVSIETIGTKPGKSIIEHGEAIVYGLTIPHKTENIKWAKKFVAFVIDPEKGGKILRELGQDSIKEFHNPNLKKIPKMLRNLDHF